MKLVRVVLPVIAAALACGCAAGQPDRVSAPTSSTATITSGSLTAARVTRDADDEGAPRVGKSQRASAWTDDEKAPRRDHGRRGGGFSGWK